MNASPKLSQPKNPSAHFGDLNERKQMRDSTDRLEEEAKARRLEGEGKARYAPDHCAVRHGPRPATDGTATSAAVTL